MIACTSNKGLFYWSKGTNHADIALATYDILMDSTDISLYDLLCSTFDKYFDYTTTTTTGSTVNFLNYRIIQSPLGTSIDQYCHLRQNILNIFFSTDTSIPFQSSPFQLDPSFKMELYTSTPLSEEDITILTIKYNGSYNH